MRNLLSIYFFILGTVFASFFGVIIERIPNNLSIIKPASRCDKCGHILNWYEKIPIISFILLKGKCKNCLNKIEPFSFIYEIIGGIALLLIYIKFGLSPESIFIMFINLLLLLIAGYDYKTQRILNISLWLLFGFSILLLIYRAYFLNYSVRIYFIDTIAVASTSFVLKILMDYIFNKESIGSGDLYLISIMALVFDINELIYAILVASFLGVVFNIYKLSKNKTNKYIAFGPYLCFGFYMMFVFDGMVIKTLTIISKSL